MSFDALAPHYRWMEAVLAGGLLQRCRTQFLDRIEPPRRALLVGEGNGRFLAPFVQKFPNAEVTCLDASLEMLKRSRAPVIIHANILDWTPDEGASDLIVTNFFLDCFAPEQLQEVIAKLSRAATPSASWLLSDFCEPPKGWRKWRARFVLTAMYAFFRVATNLPAKRLTTADTFLQKAGFRLAARESFNCGLLKSEWWRR